MRDYGCRICFSSTIQQILSRKIGGRGRNYNFQWEFQPKQPENHICNNKLCAHIAWNNGILQTKRLTFFVQVVQQASKLQSMVFEEWSGREHKSLCLNLTWVCKEHLLIKHDIWHNQGRSYLHTFTPTEIVNSQCNLTYSILHAQQSACDRHIREKRICLF